MGVGSHVQRDLEFSRYRTYDWATADALPATDPRLDVNPFFKDHVYGAVDKALADRGLARATAPDLLIHYHASITQRLDIDRSDIRHGYCGVDPCGGNVVQFEAGTLVIDVVDARTHRLVWRGWTQHRAEQLLGDPEKMGRRVDRAVRETLSRLPVRAAAPVGTTFLVTGGQ
jgi:hypothetical protein